MSDVFILGINKPFLKGVHKVASTSKRAVESGVNVPIPTLLFWAKILPHAPSQRKGIKKDINMVKYLIKCGADVNFLKHEYSDPPLFLAVASKLDDIVMELIRNGANINFMSKITKSTPLSLAISMGMFDLVKKMKEEFLAN